MIRFTIRRLNRRLKCWIIDWLGVVEAERCVGVPFVLEVKSVIENRQRSQATYVQCLEERLKVCEEICRHMALRSALDDIEKIKEK